MVLLLHCTMGKGAGMTLLVLVCAPTVDTTNVQLYSHHCVLVMVNDVPLFHCTVGGGGDYKEILSLSRHGCWDAATRTNAGCSQDR